MTRPAPLQPASTVDQLAAVLRERILDGDLEPGRRLIERELVETYDVARHTLPAPRSGRLESEGLVRVEPNRGARVASLSSGDLKDLFTLRLALEREAAHLALARGGGRLPPAVHDAAAETRPPRPAAPHVVERARGRAPSGARGARRRRRRAADRARVRGAEHRARPPSSASCRPVWTRERLGPDHLALVRDLERDGPDVLSEHMAQALRALHADAARRATNLSAAMTRREIRSWLMDMDGVLVHEEQRDPRRRPLPRERCASAGAVPVLDQQLDLHAPRPRRAAARERARGARGGDLDLGARDRAASSRTSAPAARRS